MKYAVLKEKWYRFPFFIIVNRPRACRMFKKNPPRKECFPGGGCVVSFGCEEGQRIAIMRRTLGGLTPLRIFHM